MRRALYLLDLTLFVTYAVLVAVYSPWGWRALAGFAIALAGFALWITARIQLGRSFAVTAQAKHLVTHGLYSRFRNPIYTFSCVAYLGLVIVLGWWWPLAALGGVCLFQAARAHKESIVLEKAFGEEYRQYRARTWM